MNTAKQTAAREKLYSLLGDLPARDLPITAKLLWEKELPEYRLQKLQLSLNGIEDTFAYLTLPTKAQPPYPAVVFNHSHGGGYTIGKEEYLQGREYMDTVPYATALAQEGIAGIAIDHWCFGERRHNPERGTFCRMLWQGQVLWGMMVYDSIRALDYLCTRDDIDHRRIATLGMSMGSTMAWWLAALDERICACADICCMTDFQALLEHNGIEEHGVYYYVPSLLKHFTTADINALIAPRPHLSVNGLLDPLTPEDGLKRVDEELKRVYTAMGAPDNWQMTTHRIHHFELPAMRQEILAFLRSVLVETK